ncbi:MAG TPA: hypothetical protein VGB00_05665 [Pyrinomonadaceae bacterium]|jgi:hypothetical protein
MQNLELAEAAEKAAPRKGFWQRQFQKESTESQRRFDWIFGVVLPVICFAFDPVVFKGGLADEPFLGTFKPLAYVLSFVSVMAMAAWLTWGAKLKWLNAFLAGLFAVGSVISLAVGIILLPVSLLGLLVLIGILGFTPLLTALVFLRNSARAFHAAKPFFEKRVLINSFMLGAVFSVALPTVLNIQIKRSLDAMRYGDAATIRAQAKNLKYVAPLADLDGLARRYAFSTDEHNKEKRAAFAEVYKELTGENIKDRSFID